MNRLAVIILALFSAVLLGASVAAIGVIYDDPSLLDYGWGALKFAFVVGGVFAMPVALPVIIFSELREFGRWWMFACAGVGAGLLLAFLMIPDLEIQPVTISLVATSSAALCYWVIAWRIFPPRFRSASQAGLSE